MEAAKYVRKEWTTSQNVKPLSVPQHFELVKKKKKKRVDLFHNYHYIQLHSLCELVQQTLWPQSEIMIINVNSDFLLLALSTFP